MSSVDERGIEGHLDVEKERVWDLKSTGQVTASGRNSAGIACLCFHPTDPTLCVVTVQGTGSVLSFYNAHSGGKMSTLPLQSVVAAAQFTRDGDQIVVIFRDWSVMLLRPESPVWSKTLIPFKKETRPAENLLLALSPTALPVIYFACSGQPRLSIAFSAAPTAKGSLLSSVQKASFSTRLTSAGITGLAGHPEEADILLAMIADGTIQAFALEQVTLRKLYAIGEPVQTNYGHLGQFEVIPHPLITGAALILAASDQELRIFDSLERGQIAPVDTLPLRGMKRIGGIGIHKEAHVFLVFGEMTDLKLACVGARFTGSKTTGLNLVPVNVSLSNSTTDVTVPNHSVSGIGNVAGVNGSWTELWDAVPAWAQSGSHIGSSRPRIRNVKMHSVMGAIAAQSNATGTGIGPHVLLWNIRDASHPLGGSNVGFMVPQHTPLSLWKGPSVASEYKLEFPHHCHFVCGNKLSAYGFRSKAVFDLMEFHPPPGRSGPAVAETMTYSTHHRTWLIFFRSFSANDASSYGIEEWVYTLQREDEIGAAPAWFKPGMSGVFIGPREEHCCILDLDLFTVHVYPTKTVSSKDAPLLSLALPSPGLLMPVLFQGPPITQIPKPPPPPEFTQSGSLIEQVVEEETEEKLGYGVIIWVNKFRQIAMGTMISESTAQHTRYEGDSLEIIQGGTFHELSEGEIILQVSWQTLSEEPDANQAPNSFTAAVLTSRRLMLFLANGYPILSFPPQDSSGLYSPPISALWVGPALLYATRTGEVHQLLWDGSTVMICGAPSTTGSAFLAAALADRIVFLCRETEAQSWQIATRHAIVGYALLMGWASLGSSGLMPPTWVHAQARNQMKILIQHFDTSTQSAPVARALVQSNFADVARIIARRWTEEAQQIKVACSVAALNWKEAAEGLMHEYQKSVYHPGPVPKGSVMWRRFYTVGMGAMKHGQYETAAKVFAAAGEWEQALLTFCFSSAGSNLNEILSSAKRHLEGDELSQLHALADQLRKRLLRGGMQSEATEAPVEDLSSWIFAASGYVPPMYCVQGNSPNGMVKEGDIGQIDPLETTDIKGYVSGVSKKARGGNFLRKSLTETFSTRALLTKPPVESPASIPETLEVGGSGSGLDFMANPESSASRTETGTGGPPRGFSDFGFDEKFSSDEDDGEEATSGKPGMRRASGSGKKFRIQIKKKEEGHSGTSSEALREAAKNLRLGGLSLGPSLGPSGFAVAMKGGGQGIQRTDSVSSVSSSAHSFAETRRSATPPVQDYSADPFAPKPSVSPAASDPFRSDPFTGSPSANAGESFAAGIRDMEGGNWASAVAAFSKPGVLTVPRARQYFAAVLLLQERASLTGSEAAKLDRIAAALNLEDKHKKLMTMQAVKENMSVGNYGYAKQRLEWLMESSKSQLSSTAMTALQQQLNECLRENGVDADVSVFENLDAIPRRVEMAVTIEDLKVTVNGFTF